MSKILKNQTASDVDITDVGQTVPASGQITIAPQDYLLYADSNDVVTLVGNGTLVVNDGTSDLNISDGTMLLKGIFPNSVSIVDNSTGEKADVGTKENGTTKALHVLSEVESSEASPVYIATGKGDHLDAFGNFRVTEPFTVFEYLFSYDVGFESYWATQTANGGTITHNINTGQYEVRTTTTVGSLARVSSRRRMAYYAGKSHVFNFSANPSGAKEGIRKRVGLFDDYNGFFFQLDGTEISVVIRSDITGTPSDARKITIANWNTDKLDGNGPSGLTLADLDTHTQFLIDFSWHGAGGVRFGILYKGKRYTLHAEYSGSIDTAPVTRTPILPFRAEIETVATPVSGGLATLTGCSYLVEGELSEVGKVVPDDIGPNNLTVGTTEQVVFGIRIQQPYSNSVVELLKARMTASNGNSEVYWRIIHNPVFTSSPTFTAKPGSVCETLDSPELQTLQVDTGRDIVSRYSIVGGSSEEKIDSDVALGFNCDSTVSDTFIVVARTISSNSKVIFSIRWKEIY